MTLSFVCELKLQYVFVPVALILASCTASALIRMATNVEVVTSFVPLTVRLYDSSKEVAMLMLYVQVESTRIVTKTLLSENSAQIKKTFNINQNLLHSNLSKSFCYRKNFAQSQQLNTQNTVIWSKRHKIPFPGGLIQI